MAMLNLENNKNGIQIGGPLDYCEICANKNNRINYGELEYKEIFKIYRNSTSICLCMQHFKSLLGHYLLIDQNELSEDESGNKKEEDKSKSKNNEKQSKKTEKNK